MHCNVVQRIRGTKGRNGDSKRDSETQKHRGEKKRNA